MERHLVENAETAQASDKCYACRRDLEHLFDFPIVQVTGFERLPIPNQIVLPQDREIFVDPDAKSSNRRVPEEVKALFDDDAVTKGKKPYGSMTIDLVNFEGYQWSRQKFSEVGESWYHRAKLLPSGGDLIRPVVEPFISKLESLVGQEVATVDLKPPAVTFDFPSEAGLSLSSEPLFFQEDDHKDTQRRAELHIYSHAGRIGLNQLMSSVAKIATLNYQGKVYK